MKLREQLNSMKGVNVKLGSRSGFVYCDKVYEDFETTLNKLSDRELKNLGVRLNDFETYLLNFETFWSDKFKRNLDSFNKKTISSKTKFELEKLKDKLAKEKEADLIHTKNLIARYTKMIATFTPFLEREVIEVYDSICVEGEKIIIFEGQEIGAYISRQDYLKKVAAVG